jgi:two-component system cell cycle response regulator DivK
MSKRILVVEDTENNRRILNDLLTKAGFDVIEAIDGEKGVAMAEERRPDLILMDIQLPIIDGYEATRRIKSNPDLRHIPIIAVTSYALSGDEDKARAAGCDDFVPKPYSPRQLLAKIRELRNHSLKTGAPALNHFLAGILAHFALGHGRQSGTNALPAPTPPSAPATRLTKICSILISLPYNWFKPIPQRPEVSSYSWLKHRGSELSVETSDKVTRRTRVMPGPKVMSALCPVLTEDRS